MSFAYGLHACKCSSPPPAGCHMSGWAAVEYVTFCCCLWWISYWFILLVTKQSDEWSCRFLAVCHGCTVVFSALQDIVLNKQEMGFLNCSMSEYQKNYLSYMLSYFLFDFMWIHVYGNETWIIYFHHLASIVIIIKVLVSGYGGVFISYGVAGLEFTNPYLQCRWFLRTHGYLNTLIHRAVELWFFVAFLAIRLIGGTIISYRIVKCTEMDPYMKISVLAIYFISWVLAWQILMCIKKKYWNQRRGSQTSTESPTPRSHTASQTENSNQSGNLQRKSSRKVNQTNENDEGVGGPGGSN